ncbi:MAG: hypothetical protein OXG25_15585 [Gammaproteobacteria bacterium]|nr:hypothetical protein [Gammaproteobacteria bacterium]
MAKPLRISEIHEFAEVGRIPEAAVTDEIISNVADLDERTQLEPWVQDIIHSHDQTPHGPTEIADIITRVTVGGRPTYTAFILKGKSFQKVRIRDVAHQITRLRRLKGLELAVLAAVGDIQDDVYDEFIHQARQLGCNYLVVTKLDLARLLIAYDRICSKDGLPFEDGVCSNGHSQRKELVLNYRVREDARWEVFKLRDLSHGLAKRLSATILTDRHYPQDVLRTIIVEVFQEVRTDPYLRNEMVRATWDDTPAHVVWIDIGFDIEDINRCNWVCMACWIDPDLEEEYQPNWPYDGEVHEGIMIYWNSNYHAMKKFWSEHTGRKHEVIECVEGIFARVQPILVLLDRKFTAFRQGAVTEQSLKELVQRYGEDADNLYGEAGNCPQAPPECVDYRQQFQNIMASFHNLFLLYSSEKRLNERTTENRTWLFNRNLSDLKETMPKFEYEREKLL